MSESFSTVRHLSPPAFFLYHFDANSLPGASPAPLRSPTPTVPIGPYARVTPAIALYLMASSSSFCHPSVGHQLGCWARPLSPLQQKFHLVCPLFLGKVLGDMAFASAKGSIFVIAFDKLLVF